MPALLQQVPPTQEARCWVTSDMVTHQDFSVGRWEASRVDPRREGGAGCPHGAPAAPVSAPGLSLPVSATKLSGLWVQKPGYRWQSEVAKGSGFRPRLCLEGYGPGTRALRTSQGIVCGGRRGELPCAL